MVNHGELLCEIHFNNYEDMNKHWNIEERCARHVNNELQRYTKDSFKFDNSELTIMTTRHGKDIKSGRINSKDKLEIQYGYVEVLMKFDTHKGLWPAFWMLGNSCKWPDCGEIDIMEYVGWNNKCIFGTLHGPNYCGGNPYGSGSKHILNNENDWNKYAIEWNPDCIKWYLNDQLFFTATKDELHKKFNGKHWVFNDRPFYFIINTAVGGNFGGAFPDSENYIHSKLPENNETKVKYIKIYKTSNGNGRITKQI
jgi:beta-glucanase (GH16 family)